MQLWREIQGSITDLKEDEWDERREGRSRVQALVEIDKELKKVEEECASLPE